MQNCFGSLRKSNMENQVRNEDRSQNDLHPKVCTVVSRSPHSVNAYPDKILLSILLESLSFTSRLFLSPTKNLVPKQEPFFCDTLALCLYEKSKIDSLLFLPNVSYIYRALLVTNTVGFWVILSISSSYSEVFCTYSDYV